MARNVGRATKLTPAIAQAILNAVSGGVPYVRAAALASIEQTTALQWRARGEGSHKRPATPLYVEFVQQLKKAEAQDEARRVLRINQAGQGGNVIYEKTTTYADGRVVTEVKRTAPEWTADAWHLERSQPDVWGRRERLDVRLSIERAAAKVAEEMGMTKEEVLAEATAMLRELDHAEPSS